MGDNLKQFKKIKDINRNTPEGELAFRLLVELWKEREIGTLNDLLKLVADKTYCVPIPKDDVCYQCERRV